MLVSNEQRDDELRLLAYDVRRGATGDIGLAVRDFAADGYAPLFVAWAEARAAGLASDPASLARYCAEHLADNAPVLAAADAVCNAPSVLTEEQARTCLRSTRLRLQKARASDAADRFKASLSDPFAVLDVEANRLHDELMALVPPPAANMASEVVSILDTECEGIQSGKKLFYPTGLKELDKRWGGISDEGVTLFIAISQHGKSSLANRIWFGMSAGGFGVDLHGTEAAQDQRIRDIIYSAAGLNQLESRQLPAGSKRDKAVKRLRAAGDMVKDFTGRVTGAGLELDEIVANLRSGVRAGRTELAIVDYVQDIPQVGKHSGDRVQWIGHCSQTFKDLSAELHIPILLFAQATKPTFKEARLAPRPGMFSAQWGSKLPQDAEEVFTLYSHDAMKREFGDSWTLAGLPGFTEICKRKARRTAQSTLEVRFDGHTRWFGDPLNLT